MENIFPDIIQKLPKVDFGFDGLIVHAEETKTGIIYFVFATKDVDFPEHAHGEQWTTVVNGSCKFTANGQSTIYTKGDTYTIPKDLKHQITLFAGYAEVDYVSK